ncbi:serine hydrolase domain-containing protein [Maribacter halichondriae]|uniref:serine hydrolase domain-containing protein n=1 Tax=Maribacter halichondriae TaxID=2980554 RepID=UPI002358A2D3|nr:serine hydrolase [Maribacter sp. Hal144]
MSKTISFLLFFFIGNIIFAQIDFSETHLKTMPLLTTMDSLVKDGKYENITSILIAKDGKLLFENYYNDNDRSSKHNTRSATKSIATLLTGIAIDKGFIKSENDKIFDYLKHKMPVEHPDPRKAEITIEDLLTMSSILECDDNNSFSRGNEERMYIIEDWAKFFVDLPIRSYPFGPKPEEMPYGRSMSYCSAGAAALAEIVQTAIGSSAEEFLKENLFKPLEIQNYKPHYTPTGTLNTAGGSEYQSRDFLKLIQLCLQKGTWNGQNIISKEWVEKATTPKANAWEGMDYGYLFWLRKYDRAKCFAMAGNGGNKIMAFPELGVTVVLTSTNYNNRNAHNYTDELLEKYIIPAMKL